MYIYKGYEIPETLMEVGLGYKDGYESPFMVINHESGRVYKRIDLTPFTLPIIMTGRIDLESVVPMVKTIIDRIV